MGREFHFRDQVKLYYSSKSVVEVSLKRIDELY